MYEKTGRRIELLWWKVRPKYNHDKKVEALTLEALSSLLLFSYQSLKSFYTIFGCEAEDLYDMVEKHHIINALSSPDDFPYISMKDIVGAMLGVGDSVQPIGLYDVFSLQNDKFQPDLMQYEAICCRYKSYSEFKTKSGKGKYQDFIADINLKYLQVKTLIDIIKKAEVAAGDEIYGYAIAKLVYDDYMYRFSNMPNGLPLNSDNFTISCDMGKLLVDYSIIGTYMGERECSHIVKREFNIPTNSHEIADLIIDIAILLKRELSGIEKERGGDTEATIGRYPRKDHATHGLKLSNISLPFAEYQSIYIIKKALRYLNAPALACSFGRDSVTALHLIRRVTKDDFKIVFCNTKNEYAETMELRKSLKAEWDLGEQLIDVYPKDSVTFWDFINRWGWNFERKGSRNANKYGNESKTSRSEKCAKALKHEPMKRAIAKYSFDGTFTGLRADESYSREQAGKRDGVFYYAKEWAGFRVNPILFYTDEMIIAYQNKYSVPYSKIYDMVLYNEKGEMIYSPRTGCACCMVTAGRSYLQWLRHFKPKLYYFIMYRRGLAETLYKIKLGLSDVNPTNHNTSCIKGQLSLLEIYSNEDPEQLDYGLLHHYDENPKIFEDALQ